jgi:hypothetical protein
MLECNSGIGRPLSEYSPGESEGRLIPAEEVEVYFGFFPAPFIVPAGLNKGAQQIGPLTGPYKICNIL